MKTLVFDCHDHFEVNGFKFVKGDVPGFDTKQICDWNDMLAYLIKHWGGDSEDYELISDSY